jgi:hypothetical protein
MNALQSLKYVGRACQACSSVPCAKQGAGEAVAGSMATNTDHCAKGVDRTAALCFGFPCSLEDPPCIIEAYSTSSSQISIHLCWSCACRETSEFIAFDPAVVPTLPKMGVRSVEQIREVARFSYQRRVRTNHQVVTHLSKRREQHQR